MSNTLLKTMDLFGQEEFLLAKQQVKKTAPADDYEDFVAKFEAKKTTDDCYTPPEVFQIILSHVKDRCDIGDAKVLRPFYPGGDYESVEYTADCVVIDNPPFSIITSIARFYIARGIRFFLFAPHLTLFSSDIDCTHIVVGADITYANGAVVKTSFLSNMFGDLKVIGDAELYKKFKELAASKKANLPKYKYPENVLTVSQVSYLVEKGIPVSILKHDLKHCRGLASQKIHGKAMFGSGFLISERVAAEKIAAEKAAAEKAAEKAAAEKAAEKDRCIVWELSEKERRIISMLGNYNKQTA